ncbi:MAG: hypothetical protein RM368_17315 [Nostoc sp. DedSLP03]|nr:hypothetical protein [Nostoc sp. DedSLP03]
MKFQIKLTPNEVHLVMMQAQMPYTVLHDGVLTHPTMTKLLNRLSYHLSYG